MADITGLCNIHEEPTMYVAVGHDVPREEIVRYAEHEEMVSEGEGFEIGPARNVYGVWRPFEPTDGEPSGAFGEDTMIFVECDQSTEGAEPYTAVNVNDGLSIPAPAFSTEGAAASGKDSEGAA